MHVAEDILPAFSHSPSFPSACLLRVSLPLSLLSSSSSSSLSEGADIQEKVSLLAHFLLKPPTSMRFQPR